MTGQDDQPHLRTLLSAALDLEPPAGRYPTAGSVEAAHRRRLTARVAGAASVAVVVAVVVASGIAVSLAGSGNRERAASVAVPPTLTPAPIPLILVDGSTVGASGRVVSVPGHPTRFCAPEENDQPVYPPGQEPAPDLCPIGVDVTGVDLTRLSMARTKDGATEGYAYLRGMYQRGILAVHMEASPRYPAAKVQDWTDPPCPRPAEGWNSLAPGSNPSQLEAQVTAYQRQHPGEIASTTVFRPTAQTAVIVLAVEHPDVVRRELSASPTALCVVQARYSPAQLASALQVWEGQMRSPGSAGIFAMGIQQDGAGQPFLAVSVVAVTPALHDLATKYPTGLVQLTQWLDPVNPTSTPPTAPSSAAAESPTLSQSPE
jgi:hypothetical protein